MRGVSNCTSKTPGNHPHGGAANCPECGPKLSAPPAGVQVPVVPCTGSARSRSRRRSSSIWGGSPRSSSSGTAMSGSRPWSAARSSRGRRVPCGGQGQLTRGPGLAPGVHQHPGPEGCDPPPLPGNDRNLRPRPAGLDRDRRHRPRTVVPGPGPQSRPHAHLLVGSASHGRRTVRSGSRALNPRGCTWAGPTPAHPAGTPGSRCGLRRPRRSQCRSHRLAIAGAWRPVRWARPRP